MIYKTLRHLLNNGLVATGKKIINKISGLNLYEYLILQNRIERSNYAYCCYHAASLASKLGHSKMSVIEFGCAGGTGLIALEAICKKVSAMTGVEIEIFGFDTGEGLPEPKDYRDLPYNWERGFYKMKKDILEPKLQKSTIVYGNVEDTINTFIKNYNPAVIGCAFHDFDYYSSTKAAFQLFTEDESCFLPRSFHYFDDIIGGEVSLFNSWTGERLAINEFNGENDLRKFDICHHLIAKKTIQTWYHQIRILHMFKHPQYCQFVSAEHQLNI
jgi:hypothetical protein